MTKFSNHTAAVLVATVTLAVGSHFCSSVMAQEPNAVVMDAQVTLFSADGQRSELIEQRNWQIPLGRRFTSFLGNFSVEVQPMRRDSIRSDINVFIATVGSTPHTKAKTFLVEHGLPAIIDSIPAKNGNHFRLTLIPQSYTSIDLTGCEYNHRDSGVFRSDPTANFDLHFVPNSLGDYHWNKVKGLIEDDFRNFSDAFDISVSGKLHYFLYPCASHAIDWDIRYGYFVDPTRSSMGVIYNHSFMAASSLIATLTQTLRVYGYSPPFLAEGLAGYFYFFDYDAKMALRKGELIPVKDLLNTQSYYGANPRIASAISGSFCKFITDKYGADRFRSLYSEADDLNITEIFQAKYGMSVDSLEALWRAHIDTLQLPIKRLLYLAGLSGAYGSPRESITILKNSYEWATNAVDSQKLTDQLAAFYSEVGDFTLARDVYTDLYNSTDAVSPRKMFYLLRAGYFNWLVGSNDIASEMFQALQRNDTSRIDVAQYNLARVKLSQGDTTYATSLLTSLVASKKTNRTVHAEAALMIGELYARPGGYANPDSAGKYYEAARMTTMQLITSEPQDPLHRLRIGIAGIGLGNYPVAKQNLELALFLEFRPRYIGRELVALGKLADVQGNRTEALESYRAALEVDSSAVGQAEAKSLIDKAFSIKVKAPPESNDPSQSAPAGSAKHNRDK